MFVHSVYFWLKSSLSPRDLDTFARGLDSLREIPSIRQFHFGQPADTDRPVVDRSYSFGLVIAFDDRKGHDDYQAHPIHTAFVDTFNPFWTRVLVYDFA